MCESKWGCECTFTFVVQCFDPSSLQQEVSRTLNPVTRRNFTRVNIQEELQLFGDYIEESSEGDLENSRAPLRLFQISPETVNRRILIVDDEMFNQVGLKNLIMTLPKFKDIHQLIDTAKSGE